MPVLWSQREAAEYLGVSIKWLERDRWGGATIPFIKGRPQRPLPRGGHRRVPRTQPEPGGRVTTWRAETVTLALGGRRHGRYGMARCPAHEDRRPSLSLANGTDGRLLAFCHATCTFDAILAALPGRGLIERTAVSPPLREEPGFRRAAEADAAKKLARARALWVDSETVPISAPSARSTSAAGGVTCPLPATLRFQANGWHPTALRFSMMVAVVEGVPDFAVRRTYLSADGSWKADIEPNKAMLGGVTGGAVRLSEAARPLVVSEGIETGLSLLWAFWAVPRVSGGVVGQRHGEAHPPARTR